MTALKVGWKFFDPYTVSRNERPLRAFLAMVPTFRVFRPTIFHIGNPHLTCESGLKFPSRFVVDSKLGQIENQTAADKR